MATEALMIRRGQGLAPADRVSAVALDGLPQGATVRAVLTQPRNPGHFDSYRLAGREVIRPRSISFGAMDQAAFAAFYDRCVALILTHILPGVDRADLEREVLEMIEPQARAAA